MINPYFQDELTTIYLGDNRDIINELIVPNKAILLTDPPYGIKENVNKQKGRQGHGLANQRDYGDYNWDNTPPSDEFLTLLRNKCEYSAIFGGNYFSLPPSSCWLVWDKDNGKTDFADCELVWTNFKKAVRRVKWRWQGMLQEEMGGKKEVRYHPTQKPLGVMRWIMTQIPQDVSLVLDPYCGVGSTLIAARELGIKAIGIDNHEQYIKSAIGRITGSLPLNYAEKKAMTA